MFGFININKPSGITSHKVISVLRRITGIQQIGHAGTLDPLASGVLPVAIGKASKLIDYLPEKKGYIAGLILGKKSDTYDIEGNVTDIKCNKITLEEFQEVLNSFKGEQKQIPPAYSAVHYNGKRLYELAREGKIPDDIPSRTINIYENELLNFDYENQRAEIKIVCSKGTYIRSIINDIGEKLNTGAVMSSLERILSGGLKIESAINLTDSLSFDDIKSKLINPIDIIQLDKTELNDEELKLVINGNKFKNRYNKTGDILLLKDNKIIALAVADNTFIQPKKVLL